jgi:hypothetical protein
MIPNLSKSYRAAPVCIISTAQHARPKVIGQMEPVRAQFMSASTLDNTNSAPGPPLDVVLEVGAFSVVDATSAGAPVCRNLVVAFRDAACADLGNNAISQHLQNTKTQHPITRNSFEIQFSFSICRSLDATSEKQIPGLSEELTHQSNLRSST